MKFWDEATIKIKAGDGGDGAVSFRHEKFVDKGGPDGGDGGRGGNIYLVADHNVNTLADVARNKEYTAEAGAKGSKQRSAGKSGLDLVLTVPIGTEVYEIGPEKAPEPLADLIHSGQRVTIAQGGEGGLGNAHFARSTYQVPRFAELGVPGEEREVLLRLKVVADIGLVGLPNAGKSTLLSVISSAKPKIADYPFTTLIPNLGMVEHNQFRFFAVDVPGLIEGAAEGKGLGVEFLRHIERTKLLLHLVDANSADFAGEIKTIEQEFKSFSKELIKKPRFLVITKTDSIVDKDELEKKIKKLKTKSPIFVISAVSGDGVKKLLDAMVTELKRQYQPVAKELPTITLKDVKLDTYEVEKASSHLFVVKGYKPEKYAVKTDFNNEEGFIRFYKVLQRMGVWSELKKAGAKPGDLVKIGSKSLEYKDIEKYK